MGWAWDIDAAARPASYTATTPLLNKETFVDQELFARFRKCAVEVLSVSEDQVTPEAKFGDDWRAAVAQAVHDMVADLAAHSPAGNLKPQAP